MHSLDSSSAKVGLHRQYLGVDIHGIRRNTCVSKAGLEFRMTELYAMMKMNTWWRHRLRVRMTVSANTQETKE